MLVRNRTQIQEMLPSRNLKLTDPARKITKVERPPLCDSLSPSRLHQNDAALRRSPRDLP